MANYFTHTLYNVLWSSVNMINGITRNIPLLKLKGVIIPIILVSKAANKSEHGGVSC